MSLTSFFIKKVRQIQARVSQWRSLWVFLRDLLWAAGPVLIVITVILGIASHFLAPAPPHKIVISTGDGEGNYQDFAEKYRELLKKDGIELETRSSEGPVENIQRLEKEDSGVDVGIVLDGVGANLEEPDLVSLGSIQYEPLWFFVRGSQSVDRFSELKGRRVALGPVGSGSQILGLSLLQESGVDAKNTSFVYSSASESARALQKGEIDAAIFLAEPEDDLIERLTQDSHLQLMNLSQAEAISRQFPFLHHLVLPQGVLSLKDNRPSRDIHMLAATATLIARDDLHPTLIYLLLKAAQQVHSSPGIFAKKNEFPADNDHQFPLSPDAKNFYKSGGPFWLRYLPFWLASWIDQIVLIVIPTLVVIFPLLRTIPQIYRWRIRSRIFRRYGELYYLETQIKKGLTALEYEAFTQELDGIDERVHRMKVPLEFVDHTYSLRGHIEFVRERLRRFQRESTSSFSS